MNARRYHIKKTFISIMGQPHSKHPANDESGEVEASKMWSAATTRQWDNRSRWSKRNWEEYITGRVLLFLFTFHHSDINSRGSRCSYYVSSIVSGRHQRKWVYWQRFRATSSLWEKQNQNPESFSCSFGLCLDTGNYTVKLGKLKKLKHTTRRLSSLVPSCLVRSVFKWIFNALLPYSALVGVSIVPSSLVN